MTAGHPLMPAKIDEMEKQAWLLPLLAWAPKVLSSIGTIAGLAWGANEIRRLLYPPAEHSITVYPTIDVAQQYKLQQIKRQPMPSQPPQVPASGFPARINRFFSNLPGGYTIPGAVLGATLGGLIGRNVTGTILGGLAGGGLGYLANRYMNTPRSL